MEPYALALPRDDHDFRLAVNRVLAGLYRDGGIKPIYERWLGPMGSPSLLLTADLFHPGPRRVGRMRALPPPTWPGLRIGIAAPCCSSRPRPRGPRAADRSTRATRRCTASRRAPATAASAAKSARSAKCGIQAESQSRRRQPSDQLVFGAVVLLPFGPGGKEEPYVGGVGTQEMAERLGNTTYEITVRMDTGERQIAAARDGGSYRIGERVTVSGGMLARL